MTHKRQDETDEREIKSYCRKELALQNRGELEQLLGPRRHRGLQCSTLHARFVPPLHQLPHPPESDLHLSRRLRSNGDALKELRVVHEDAQAGHDFVPATPEPLGPGFGYFG